VSTGVPLIELDGHSDTVSLEVLIRATRAGKYHVTARLSGDAGNSASAPTSSP